MMAHTPKKGLERYKKAESSYEQTKRAQKMGTASRKEVRLAKKKLNDSYDKLKLDKAADEGKKLYSMGKTIGSNNAKTLATEAAIIAGGKIVSAVLANYGNLRIASISGSTIAIGGTLINGILAARTNSENKKLRAYYAHGK